MCVCVCVPMQVTYFTNSGSEANELAVLMARLHTGNFDIVSLRWSHHNSYQHGHDSVCIFGHLHIYTIHGSWIFSEMLSGSLYI